MKYVVQTTDTHREISRHNRIDTAARAWNREYHGSDPGTYKQVQVVDPDGNVVPREELVDLSAPM